MTELDRILSLARGPAPEVPALGGPGALPLRAAQEAALVEFVRALRAPPGPWGPPGGAYLLGCGAGKTLVELLLPALAEKTLGRPVRTLTLVPASLTEQLVADANRWSATYPTPGSGALRGEWRAASHESLSAPSGRHLLRDFAPGLLVIDEAHAFANPESGRWRRVSEYLRARPDTRVVVLSGTLTWKSLRQARHLLLAALRGWCPLPADRSIEHWAAVIDVGSEPCADDYRAVLPLCAWAGSIPIVGAGGLAYPTPRAAYRARLTSCPGVVLSVDVEAPVSLRITAWRPATPMPPAIAAAVRGLEDRWELPDGTELVSALEIARHGATLPMGLYQRWVPETIDPDWLARRRAWGIEVRRLVAYVGHRYQTPAAVEAGAKAGTLDERAMAAWRAWDEVSDMDGPDTEPVVLEGAREYLDAVVREAVYAGDTYKAESRCLVWTQTPELGRMVADVMGGAWAYHGAGSSPPTGGPAVASIRVHGKGWDGAPRAGYTRALVLEPPSSAATMEQLLARHHRSGATEDVEVAVLASTRHGIVALANAFAGARYVEQTMGARQRLLLADVVGYDRSAPSDAADALDFVTNDDNFEGP